MRDHFVSFLNPLPQHSPAVAQILQSLVCALMSENVSTLYFGGISSGTNYWGVFRRERGAVIRSVYEETKNGGIIGRECSSFSKCCVLNYAIVLDEILYWRSDRSVLGRIWILVYVEVNVASVAHISRTREGTHWYLV